jgi:hypothetical protein
MTIQISKRVYGLMYKYDCEQSHYIYETIEECNAQILSIVAEYKDNWSLEGFEESTLQEIANEWCDITEYEEYFEEFSGEINNKALDNSEHLLLEEILQSVNELIEKRGSPAKIKQMRALTEAICNADTIILE